MGNTGWYGPKKAPWQWMKAEDGYTPMDVVNATKQATADMLVESLAPFLIMAEETSFFGYGVSDNGARCSACLR